MNNGRFFAILILHYPLIHLGGFCVCKRKYPLFLVGKFLSGLGSTDRLSLPSIPQVHKKVNNQFITHLFGCE